MMSNDNMVQLLILLAGVIGIVVIVLIFVWFTIRAKEKRAEREKASAEYEKSHVKKSQVIYTPESIIDFMDFDRIEDNMIIQKRGKFLMVVECQGINYDLMSEMEKVSVEQGFISFLNTLRHPVQLYIQTRTINLERSIDGYKSRLSDIDKKYLSLQDEYDRLLKDKTSSITEIEKAKYELVKQKNLKEYTEDIIRDIERQSLNRSILNKRYYVIIPCYQSEIVAGDFDKSEVKNMAFSELYTRARAVINSLFACQVTGKVLNSEELTELLYIAYNRDESDLFWMEKIKQAGFDELYSTAPDAIEKKLKLLDKKIEEESVSLANQKIGEARRDKEIKAMEMEKNQEKLVQKKAKEIIQKHKRYIGEDVAESAIEKIEKDKDTQAKTEKEDLENGNVQEKGKRGRPRRKA
ncbi:MAG: hypothetical protein V8R39_01715 [Clostridia bacterium]|jgi:hypothetical protein cdiviTM7_00582